MTLETYINFLGATGKKAIPDDGYIWCYINWGFYQSFPVHRPIHPPRARISKILWETPAVGLRYGTDNHTGSGRSSFVYVCKKGEYTMNRLSANNRSKVRRGLKLCHIAPITNAEYFRKQGWALNAETLQRQGRLERKAKQKWEKLTNCLGRFEGMEVWGAWVNEALASFVLTFQIDGCVNLLTFRSSKEHLRFYPNNALIHTVVSEMLGRDNVEIVSFGEESLQELTSLDAFKIGMGFQKQPIVQKIVLHPAVGWVFNRLTRQIVQNIAHHCPHSTFWKKAAGVTELL